MGIVPEFLQRILPSVKQTRNAEVEVLPVIRDGQGNCQNMPVGALVNAGGAAWNNIHVGITALVDGARSAHPQ